MADEFLNIEWNVICYIQGDARLLKVALEEKLAAGHFFKPSHASTYRGFIEHPAPPPNNGPPVGVPHVRRWAKQLVAAKRPPWVEPAPAEQHVEHRADTRPKPARPTTTKRTPKITATPGNSKRQAITKDAPPEKRQPREIPREILWLNQVLLDVEHGEKPAMPTNCFRVAYVISQLWSPRTDDAWPSQSTIAEILKLDRTTVSHLIRPLVDHGHVEVKAGRGRGNTSRYRPIIKEPVIRKLIAAEKPPKPTV